MSSKPRVRSDSFWGDLANALLMSPVHRKPLPPRSAESTPQEQQATEPQQQTADSTVQEPQEQQAPLQSDSNPAQFLGATALPPNPVQATGTPAEARQNGDVEAEPSHSPDLPSVITSSVAFQQPDPSAEFGELLTTLTEDQLEGLGLTTRQAWTMKELYRGTSAAKLRQVANIQYGLSYHPELEQLFKKFGTKNVHKLKAIILDRFERTYSPNPPDNSPGLPRMTNSEASLRGTGKHNAHPAASTEGKTTWMTFRSDNGSPLTPQQLSSFTQAHGRPPKPGETWEPPFRLPLTKLTSPELQELGLPPYEAALIVELFEGASVPYLANAMHTTVDGINSLFHNLCAEYEVENVDGLLALLSERHESARYSRTKTYVMKPPGSSSKTTLKGGAIGGSRRQPRTRIAATGRSQGKSSTTTPEDSDSQDPTQ